MPQKKSLAVARLWLEVNSFSPLPTGLSDYEQMEWGRGSAFLRKFTGTSTELGAVARFAEERPDWEVDTLRCAAASPGGPMEDDLYEEFTRELLEDLKRRRYDAVYLSLHGALATPARPAADLDLIRAVRETIGKTPLGATFDMHANLGGDLAELLTISSGYRTLPHVDMDPTASKVLRLLVDTVDGKIRPVGHLARPGQILHSFNMRTEDGPMRRIEDAARAAESPPLLDVTPYGGFPYADGPYTGASVLAYSDGSSEAARSAAHSVCDAFRENAGGFAVSRPSAEDGLLQALQRGDGPVAVLESADNTYSGGIADTPCLLRALLDLKPRVPALFAFLHDPSLVERAALAGVGASLRCQLGARVTRAYGEPISTDAVVLRVTDGKFRNVGPMFQGIDIDYGGTVLLKVDNVNIIVTARRLPVNDIGFFNLHEIEINDFQLICIKAKNHFRASFSPYCRDFIEVDTPGPAAINLHTLPYRFANLEEFVR